jgi:hypothetical protein
VDDAPDGGVLYHLGQQHRYCCCRPASTGSTPGADSTLIAAGADDAGLVAVAQSGWGGSRRGGGAGVGLDVVVVGDTSGGRGGAA